MARRLSRRAKSSWLVAALGAGAGLAAFFLWKKYRTVTQQPLITVGTPTVSRVPVPV